MGFSLVFLFLMAYCLLCQLVSTCGSYMISMYKSAKYQEYGVVAFTLGFSYMFFLYHSSQSYGQIRLGHLDVGTQIPTEVRMVVGVIEVPS